tara:strand:+ start:194710 stop:195072 length:363 start_codon:yes stop_codon:yes gene_type:complete
MIFRAETTSTTTSDATPKLFFTCPAGDRALVIFIQAYETGGSRANHRRFAYHATRYTTFEASVLVDSISMHADDGSAGGAAWAIEIQDNGAGALEVNVIGAAATNITWTAMVHHWDTSTI